MTQIIEFCISNEKKKLNVLTHKLDDAEYILIHLHGLHSCFQFTLDCPDEFYNRVSILKKGKVVSYGLEFNGHGKSEGRKGYLNNFDTLIDDLDCLVNYVSNYHNNLPIYLLGESLGGSVAIKYCHLNKDKIKGIILLAPLLGLKDLPSYNSIKFIINCSYILPSINLKYFLTRENQNENEEYKNYLRKNIYNFTDKLTLCSVRECYLFCKWWENNIKEFNTPSLFFHSKKDMTTDYEYTKKFYELSSKPCNEFISYNNSSHNLLVPKNENDINPFIILHKITNWIRSDKDWDEIKL